jgi:hypothetical protein
MSTSGGKAAAVVAANVLDAYSQVTVTQAATTILTVPAGRTWVGQIGAACVCTNSAGTAAAAAARASFSIAGAGATPPAGNIFAVEARTGTPTAAAVDGMHLDNFGWVPLTVVAPAGNAVTIQLTTLNVGAYASVDAFAIGALQ